MPITVRRRGKIYYARGTVRVGTESIKVPEFCTGAGSHADAQSIAGDHEAKIRREILEGDSGRKARLTLSDCFEIYLQRPAGVQPYDVQRGADFNDRIGHRPVAEANQAWNEWLSTRGCEMAPATAIRWRAILMAALKAGTEAN